MAKGSGMELSLDKASQRKESTLNAHLIKNNYFMKCMTIA